MSYVRFLGEVTARQFCFEINWPLTWANIRVSLVFRTCAFSVTRTKICVMRGQLFFNLFKKNKLLLHIYLTFHYHHHLNSNMLWISLETNKEFQPIVIFAFFERVILCPRQFNAGIIQSESKTNAKLFFAKPVSWIVLSTHYLELYSQFEFNTKVFYR